MARLNMMSAESNSLEIVCGEGPKTKKVMLICPSPRGTALRLA
jgi:hypothetical protein